MVTKSKSLHKIGVLTASILFIIMTIISIKIENNTCLGVPTISAEKYDDLLLNQTSSTNVEILFNGVSAAVDKLNNVIYIPQHITEKTQINDLKGILTAKNSNFQLVIKRAEDSDSLNYTTDNGPSFNLLATGPGGEYAEYRIIFTSLPVMNIHGEVTGIADNNTDLFSGEVTFFDANSAETTSYRTVSSNAQWHIRGNATKHKPKKSWKLSLKDSSNNNQNKSFYGLGEDDDWILNSMSMDDLRLREKLFMDIWNENPVLSDARMSQGEFVEVVANGKYCGLYLLQRRIDQKYLQLDDEILLKGNSYYTENIFAEYYEIISSPMSDEDTYRYIEKQLPDNFIKHTDLDNWIETNLYIQAFCAPDNKEEKNIFLLISDINDDFKVKYIPWDTDMSFGIIWNNDIMDFVYDYEQMVYIDCQRGEYEDLLQVYPELDKMLANRWFELRKDVLSNENIFRHIDDLYDTITLSGSLQRDTAQWGYNYDGIDNMNNLYSFINARLEYYDNYYSTILNKA